MSLLRHAARHSARFCLAPSSDSGAFFSYHSAWSAGSQAYVWKDTPICEPEPLYAVQPRSKQEEPSWPPRFSKGPTYALGRQTIVHSTQLGSQSTSGLRWKASVSFPFGHTTPPGHGSPAFQGPTAWLMPRLIGAPSGSAQVAVQLASSAMEVSVSASSGGGSG